MDFSAKVVEQDGSGGWNQVGSTLSGLPAASAITTVRNGEGHLTLEFPRDHAYVGALLGSNWLKRELQIYRGSSPNPYWWGIPESPSKNLGSETVRIQFAESIPWLLARRFFGRLQRRNYLLNADFGSGAFSPWTTTGVDTAAVTAADQGVSPFTAQLTEASNAPDASVQQTFTFSTGELGAIVVLAAWFRIVSWSGPAIENRGLFYEYRINGVLQYHAFEPITQRHAQNRGWQRLEIPLSKVLRIPASSTVQINVRGQSIKGVIRWARFFAGVMESTGAHPWDGTDIGTVAAKIVQQAQSPGYDKDDLDIEVSMPNCGQLIFDVWQHEQHANIWRDGLMSLVDREDGLDFGYAYTPGSRTIVGYDRTHGRAGIGTDRRALNLSIPNDYVADYGWDLAGRDAASWFVLMGDGDGPDREDGSAEDASLFGGRSLEWVDRAPADTRVADLNQKAVKELRHRKRPGLFQLALKPGVVWGNGDRVSLPAYDGAVLPGVYRVAETAHNPYTDQMIVGVEQML